MNVPDEMNDDMYNHTDDDEPNDVHVHQEEDDFYQEEDDFDKAEVEYNHQHNEQGLQAPPPYHAEAEAKMYPLSLNRVQALVSHFVHKHYLTAGMYFSV